MSRCLLLDTSMWGLVVGVGVDGVLIDFTYFPEQRAVARSMTDHVQALLQRNGFSREDLEEIRVSQGPGSFTGIRMGLAWAYGFSAGIPEIPLLGMSSLEAITEALHAKQEANQLRTAVFLENKGAAGYVTVVDGSTATYACEISSGRIAHLTGVQELVRWVRPWAAIESTSWAQQAAGRALGEAEYVQLVLHGMLRKMTKEADTHPLPRYLRGSTAEEALEKKKGALV